MGTLMSKLRGDRGIWVAVILLGVLSILVVYSSTGTLAYKNSGGDVTHYLFAHFFTLVFGILLLYGATLINPDGWPRFFQLFFYLAIALLLATLLYGLNLNSAKRSLQLPFFNKTVQTFEIAKLATVGYMARILHKNPAGFDSFKELILKLFLPLVLACGLIVPANFSTAAILFITGMVIMFVGRVKWQYLFYITLIGIGAFVIFILVLKALPDDMHGRLGTWKSRIENFRSEKPNPDEVYQTEQSKIAIATAPVLFGKLPGNSTQRNFLPHPYSDFIFAIIVEEYGLIIGGIGVMGLYLIILYRMLLIAKKSNRRFGVFYAAGFGFMIVFQAFINMAVAVNLVPVTGQPLPMVSMGGTSIIFTAFGIGVVQSFSERIKKKTNGETADEEE